MKNLTLLYTSVSVIASLVFSSAQASEELSKERNPQALTTRVIQKSDGELYQEALNYRDGKIVGFPKDTPGTLRKAEFLFVSLANNGHQKAMHNAAMIQYKMEDYLSAFKWFREASESGLEASSRNLQKMKKEIEENKLKFKSLEEEQELKSLIRKMAFKERFGDENRTILDILPTEVMDYILDFFALDEIPQLQSVSKAMRDIIALKFEHIGQKTVHPHDILYFRSIHGNDAPLDWKRLSICHNWVEQGCTLLSKMYLADKEEGLKLLQRAAENGSLRAHKKLIKKLLLAVSKETTQIQEEAKKLTLKYLFLLRSILPSIGLSPSDQEYLQAKYCTERQESMKAFARLADKNHPKALYKLSTLTKNLSYLERSSEAGYARAQAHLGYIMRLKRNYIEAKRLLQLAANKNNRNAQFQLAVILDEEGDIERAKQLYILAAKQGFAEAQYHIGKIMQREKKPIEAKHWLKLAADQNNPKAQCALALILDEEGNIEETKELYILAANQGHPVASNNLAVMHENEGNIKEAKKLYALAVDQGYVIAQYNLAVMHENEGNIEEAKKLYALAANQGHVGAQNNLAVIHENEGDIEKAKQLYTLAANQGDAEAQNYLAVIHKNGGNAEEAKK